jgi:oligogalacturonide lyase
MSFGRGKAQVWPIFWVLLFATMMTAHAEPPVTWIDPATGHRVWRLSSEPDSSGLYFNLNACTPDGRTMVYIAPDGIHALDLATRKTRLVVPNGTDHASVISVGERTGALFFLRAEPGSDPAAKRRAIFKANLTTGAITHVAVLPPGTGMPTINADETLAASAYEEGPAKAALDYGSGAKPALGPDGKPLTGGLVQPANKGDMMKRRLAAHIPLALFTLDLRNGVVATRLHSTDWLSHFQFSPTDPALLMYCHEGPWQEVDRIWLIHADGSGNLLVHRRAMEREIAGHEFWGADGRTIWYDLQTPMGRDFWLAGYEPQTDTRIRYHLRRDEWSIHYNVSDDGRLFCGDGGDPGPQGRNAGAKWIELLRPQSEGGQAILAAERLVDMTKHDYRQEPNVRFTPDGKMVVFTGNIFGRSYLFGVEVAKAKP